MTVPYRVLVLGGSSEIGSAIVRELSRERPVSALLLGRDTDRLRRAAAELPAADVGRVDAEEPETHGRAIDDAFEALGGADLVVHCVGVLGGQAGLDADPDELVRVLRVNLVGAGSLLWHALRALRRQGHGTLMLLSSVAGERVRATNAPYGAAKAGLDGLAQGLADGLAGTGVRVIVIRPGFVHSRMTAGLAPAPLAVTPDAVARAAVAGLRSGASTVWVPASLRYVMGVLRHLPRWLFARVAR
ncbi:MAG: SDR family NAD(P)-dependent oxidoreductase [Solirubrobacterales bacterium]|nr:SDR family NAD(P)-dependent oxidoreductase [Solirubrobacterales bacterium]